MDIISANSGFMTRFALFFAGQPLFKGDSWQETANAAVRGGFAKWAFGTLFTLVPGAEIKPSF